MKKLIVLLLVLGLATSSFCQQQSFQKIRLTQEDYRKKSKNQKKIGWILLGGGAVLSATAFIIPQGESEGYDACLYLICESHKNDGIIAAFGLSGTLSMLGSIPFFIASGKNKRRANAISASFKTENTSIARGYNITSINYPALSLKIALH